MTGSPTHVTDRDDLTHVPCPQCRATRSLSVVTRTESVLHPRPWGDYSLAGVQVKYAATETVEDVKYLVCGVCGWAKRGKQDPPAAPVCDTCPGTPGYVKSEYDGSPGSHGWFTCPDCGPTPSVHMDDDFEPDTEA